MKQVLQGLWIFFFVFYTAYFFRHYSELPVKFVTHWDASGRPNGWSLKEDFRNQFYALTLFVNALFVALAYFINVIPETMLNWPNKAWWFATPERKQIAFARIQSIFFLSGIYLNVVFLFCIHIIFQSAKVPVLFEIPVNVGAFFVLGLSALLVLACLWLSFRKPEIT